MARMTAQHPAWGDLVLPISSFSLTLKALHTSCRRETGEYSPLFLSWKRCEVRDNVTKKLEEQQAAPQSFTSFNLKNNNKISIYCLVQQHCQIDCFSLQCIITRVISGQPSRDYNLNQCPFLAIQCMNGRTVIQSTCLPHVSSPNHHLAQGGH